MQIIEPDPLVKEEDMRSVRVVATPNTRGMITDRNGHPLAVSVPVEAIWADPATVLDKGGVGVSERWQALAQELNIPLDQLNSRIHQNPHARFIYLARQVEPDVAEYIQRLRLPGIAIKEESRRFYPSGDIAANLVGFTNIDDQGIEGVEKALIHSSVAPPAAGWCVKIASAGWLKISPRPTAIQDKMFNSALMNGSKRKPPMH